MRARGDRGRTGQGRFVLHGKPGHGAGAGKNAVAALLHRGRVRRHYGRSGARGNGRCGAGETGGDGMNAPLATRSWRGDFPGVADWHYLDTAATAQKPQQVVDAIARAYGADYATVHRGVYARSANMTLAYEAARRRVAQFIGAASDSEIIFVRGATEGINLVAHSWGGVNLKPGDRIMLSVLEHHSNIVPWQLIAERTGAQIDVAPLTEDGKIDLDAMGSMLTPRHKIVALAHVSTVLGSVLDVRREAAMAPRVGAEIMLEGCPAVQGLGGGEEGEDLECVILVSSQLLRG